LGLEHLKPKQVAISKRINDIDSTQLTHLKVAFDPGRSKAPDPYLKLLSCGVALVRACVEREVEVPLSLGDHCVEGHVWKGVSFSECVVFQV
jgi:hypothetical protein